MPATLFPEVHSSPVSSPEMNCCQQCCQVANLIAKFLKLAKFDVPLTNFNFSKYLAKFDSYLNGTIWRFLNLFCPNSAKFRPNFGYLDF